ncbi:MAG: hypothetical protein PHC81_02920 [Clostridia bacterium]|nr:hypothetical protein [Clostridia bacterium]
MVNLMLSFLLILLLIVMLKYLVRYIVFLFKKLATLRDEPVFYKEKDAVLDDKIAYIQKQTCSKKICGEGVYQVPAEIRKELKKNKFSPEALQELADSIVAHTGVYNTVKVIVDDLNSDSISGLYEAHGKISWELHLYKDLRYNLQQIIAILVHECMHNFLFYYNLELFPEEDNEILTDVTAVYLGFGKLLMQGYKPIKEIVDSGFAYNDHNFVVDRWKIGYLDLSDLAYVMRKMKERAKVSF